MKKRLFGFVVFVVVTASLVVYDLASALFFAMGMLFMLGFLDWMELIKVR